MLQFIMITVCLVSPALAATRPSSRAINPEIQDMVGGNEAQMHSWPWQASLRDVSGSKSDHFCGASIISERWLITAAHCIEDYVKDGESGLKDLEVVVGDHHTESVQASEVTHSVREIIWHENYNGNSLETEGLPYDIALIKVADRMVFNDYVQPISLPESDDLDLMGNPNCWISGWGKTHGTGDQTKLNEMNIEVRSMSDCKARHGDQLIRDSQICIGYGARGACQGDSGGPLSCYVNGKWVLSGLGSWVGGENCQSDDDVPNVYTRVSKYLDWISENSV